MADSGQTQGRIISSTGLVFLSGGSALNELARSFATSGLNVTHLIAVFDNGGSTAQLRPYCNIAIGDIRNRLIAIRDSGSSVAEQMGEVLNIRLRGNKPQQLMRRTVEELAEGSSEYLARLPEEFTRQVSQALKTLLLRLPDNFDWREASIGNFILVGKYLEDRDWSTTLEWAHSVLSACGQVLPITIEGAHLGARLENGDNVVGQSRLTDELKPIRSPIQRLLLHPTDKSFAKTAKVQIFPAASDALRKARAIIYSWGSFYTSVLSGFLVDGVAEAVLESTAAKVLLINPLCDAEILGKTPVDLVKELTVYSRKKTPDSTRPAVTHAIALKSEDASSAQYYNSSYREVIEQLGVEVIEMECNGNPKAEQLEKIKSVLISLSEWKREWGD